MLAATNGHRPLSGRTGSLRTRSSHTTVRTVPYTAVQSESDGGPLMGLKEVEESESVEMAVWEGLVDPGDP
jgi:hypothetical protein